MAGELYIFGPDGQQSRNFVANAVAINGVLRYYGIDPAEHPPMSVWLLDNINPAYVNQTTHRTEGIFNRDYKRTIDGQEYCSAAGVRKDYDLAGNGTVFTHEFGHWIRSLKGKDRRPPWYSYARAPQITRLISGSAAVAGTLTAGAVVAESMVLRGNELPSHHASIAAAGVIAATMGAAVAGQPEEFLMKISVQEWFPKHMQKRYKDSDFFIAV